VRNNSTLVENMPKMGQQEENLMPKIKSHSGAKKRFKLTKSGRVKRGSAFTSHILNKKTRKVKRNNRHPQYVDKTNEAAIKQMLPYA
jgi:large subunit ribosomal protein L35